MSPEAKPTKPSPAGDAVDQLGGIGRTLAESLKAQPLLAAIALALVIGALATAIGVFVTKNALLIVAFLVIVAAAVLFLALIYREQQRLVDKAPVVEPSRTPMELAHGLPQERKELIRKILASAAASAAEELRVPRKDVRGNIFALDSDGNLRIVPELMYNMDRADEASLAMPPGVGSTGRSFSNGKPNFAVSRENWGADAIDDEQTRHVHPELEWIISIPIQGADKQPIWIMNVDGLIHRRAPEQLKEALVDLLQWAELAASVAAQETTE